MKPSPLAALNSPIGFILLVSFGLNIVLLRPWEQRTVTPSAKNVSIPPGRRPTRRNSEKQVLVEKTSAVRTQEPTLENAVPSPVVIRQNRASFLAPCNLTTTTSGDMHAEKERIHAQGMKERKLYWQYLNGELSSSNRADWSPADPRMSPAYIHWSVEPTWSCNIMQRLGTLGDGGKEMCDAKRLLTHRQPLVYSFGSKLECDFERQLKKDFPTADIHVFDPTPGVVEGFSSSQCSKLVSFHPTGLGGYTKSLYLNGINSYGGRNVKLEDLLSIQASLGHQNRVIDVLKIDIEGSEFDAFSHLAANAKNWPGAKLIMLEVHLANENYGSNWKNGLKVFQKLFSDFNTMGFRVYYKEINPYDGRRCVEYALINDKYLR